MAVGTIKRHDTEPSPRLVINAASGGAYDLTNHSVKMLMRYSTTLSTAMDDSQLTMDVPAAVVDVIELGDIVLIDHERLTITSALPTQPVVGATAQFNVSRATGVSATAGAIFASKDVDGQGANQYRLGGTDAVFTLSVDSGTPAAVTVLSAGTQTNNSMADLVADVQSAVTLAGLAVTVGNQNDKLTFTSNSTGATSNVAISSPDSIADAELGLVAAYGVGEAAATTTAVGHVEGADVNILKIDRTAIVEDPATDGTVTFEWVTGDTDKLGTFVMEFEVITPQGKKFTAPINDSFDVEIVADFDDA